MVQGIMELLFDAAYLVFALAVGIYLIVKGKNSSLFLYATNFCDNNSVIFCVFVAKDAKAMDAFIYIRYSSDNP